MRARKPRAVACKPMAAAWKMPRCTLAYTTLLHCIHTDLASLGASVRAPAARARATAAAALLRDFMLTRLLLSLHLLAAADDRAALEALYHATGGAGWRQNTGWLGTDEPCSGSTSNWENVGCANDGTVHYLCASATCALFLRMSAPHCLPSTHDAHHKVVSAHAHVIWQELVWQQPRWHSAS